MGCELFSSFPSKFDFEQDSKFDNGLIWLRQDSPCRLVFFKTTTQGYRNLREIQTWLLLELLRRV